MKRKSKSLRKIVAALRDQSEMQQLGKDLLRTLSQKDQAEIAAQMLPIYEAQVAQNNDMVQFFRALKVGAISAV